MRKIPTLLLAGLLSAAATAAGRSAVKASQPPRLDGKLDDACWTEALRFDQFFVLNTSNPGFPTVAHLLYDDDALYVGFHCVMPRGGVLKAAESKRDGKVWNDDCVEIMVDPNATADRYFHFVVNANGAVFDRVCVQGGHVGDNEWNGEVAASAFKDGGFWSCEVEIPFYTLDINPDGGSWGFNFCRNSRQPLQEASTAPNGAFNVAGSFLVVRGFDMDVARYGWELSPPAVTTGMEGGRIKLDVALPVENLTTAAQKARITICMDDGADDGRSTEIARVNVDGVFEARAPRTVNASGTCTDLPRDFRCIVSVTDPVTQRLLKRRVYPVKLTFAPLTIELVRPHYRDAVFASQQLAEVVYSIKSNLAPAELKNAELTTGIRSLEGEVLCEATLDRPGVARFPVASLPEARMIIFADAKRADGQLLARVSGLWGNVFPQVFSIKELGSGLAMP